VLREADASSILSCILCCNVKYHISDVYVCVCIRFGVLMPIGQDGCIYALTNRVLSALILNTGLCGFTCVLLIHMTVRLHSCVSAPITKDV
jgi:hypothetical protein